jgi:hypothetical protein
MAALQASTALYDKPKTSVITMRVKVKLPPRAAAAAAADASSAKQGMSQ